MKRPSLREGARPRASCLAIAILLLALTAASRVEAATPGPCHDGMLPGGALSRICAPAAGWNGDLVVWAHGYVAPDEPLGFYHLNVGGVELPDVVQRLGFAFATTSFRVNGLAVLPAIDDILELVSAAPAVIGGPPNRVYLVGASEGALATVLAIERYPHVFAGGLAACGPIGSFARQIDYVGDFRVLFDYFFAGVLPGSPVEIPAELMANWDAVYVPAIQSALAADPAAARDLIRTSRAAADPAAARDLIRTSRAAVDPASFDSVITTAVNVLWYNAFATNDAVAKLGGNPYSNRGRFYLGSRDDLRLNLRVQRISADPAARAALGAYEASGRLAVPLVTIHTNRDEVVPFAQELIYMAKVGSVGFGGLLPRKVDRYGHCEFTAQELLRAFARLLLATRR